MGRDVPNEPLLSSIAAAAIRMIALAVDMERGPCEIQSAIFCFLHLFPCARPGMLAASRSSALAIGQPARHVHQLTARALSSRELLWCSMWSGVPGTLWSLWLVTRLDLAHHLSSAWSVIGVPLIAWGESVLHM